MRRTWLIIFVVLNVYTAANGTSNDIVGTMRCRLLCEEAGGYGAQLDTQAFCRCSILKKLSDKQQLRVQELSTYYNLPVVFKREHSHYKVKRQLDENLLEDWRAKMDDHWAETAENLKAWREQQARENPLLGNMEEQAENLKAWHEQQARENPLMTGLEEQAENLKQWHKQHIEENPLISDLEEHAANLQAWHNDNVEMIQEGLQEQKDKIEEHIGNLKELGDAKVGSIGPQLEEQAKQLKNFHEEHIEPLLGAPLPSFEESMDKFKQLCNKQEAEPILGQMAPSLTTYDSKATGIGGSNVNFPPPNHPNPFIPPLAHIISAIPFPRFNIPVGSGAPAVAPAPAPVFSSGGAGPIAPFPRLFSRSYVAPSLPANYPGPYNPKNPIVVQPVIIPRADAGTPKPILSSLKNSVDDMLAKMKKNGGRLVPENYLNSDALSNSESQVNQINVNVRFEPTPTPPNLYSFFMPWGGRNWLSAPVPKNLDANGDEVTENPGINEDSDEDTNDKTRDNDNDEDDEDFEEEHRMQNQLKDADKSKFNAHVVDSVKKNLSGKGSRPTHEENEELDAAKYGNGLIVQPKQFMQDSEEDLQTLAK